MPITLGDTSITGLGVGGLPAGVIQSANIASGQTFTLNGISFPATQVASANANTLDDYEEGTWSPVVSDGTNTVSLGTGGYTKVGRVVHLTCPAYNVNITTLSAGAHLRITGMPFLVNTSNGGALYANAFMAQRNPVVTGINEANGTTTLFLYTGENNATDYGLFTRNAWSTASSMTFRFYLVYNTST